MQFQTFLYELSVNVSNVRCRTCTALYKKHVVQVTQHGTS